MHRDGPSLDRRTTIAVRPGHALDRRSRLFGSLEAAFPVTFVPVGSAPAAPAATIAFLDAGRPVDPEELALATEPLLAIGGEALEEGVQPVALGDSAALDRRLRGIEIPDRLGGPSFAGVEGAARTLAAAPSGPAWVLCGKPGPVHLVRSALPELREDQILRDLLRERALALVALVQFLRAASAADGFRAPPLRAAFLFDDPNLRWRTYGFIDYRRLLEQAAVHGYHASMAMVPLDGRLQHAGTIDLFRRNRKRLSLVFHGNNHVSGELTRPSTESAALALAAQAIRRAERFEARYGLSIDRVMTPPHGMCSPSMSRALGAVGFAALCAIHPLPWAERPPASRPLAGWDPAEFAAGCAVIPRLHLSSTDADLALRAFLGQPLVFYGHHEDLAEGLEPLAEIAARVDRLGEATWCSLGEIAATNFASRREPGLLRVRPYSGQVRVRIPAAGSRLVVEQPRGGGSLRGWSIGTGPPVPFGSAVPVPGGEVVLRLRRVDETSPQAVHAPPRRPWPILRKIAMEARDRTAPLRL